MAAGYAADPVSGSVTLADDYLELVKDALTHSLYAEVDGGVHFRRNLLARTLFALLKSRDIVPVRIGPRATDDRRMGRHWPVFAQTMVGRARLDSLQCCVEDVIDNGVSGDLIETGVWRGGASILMKAVLKARGVTDRTVWACDSFEGFPPPCSRYSSDAEGEPWHRFGPLRVGLEEVTDNFARYRLLDDNVKFIKGWFTDTLPGLSHQHWAVIRLDGDMYQSTADALTHLYPNLTPGGYLVVDDYEVAACRQAVHDYRDEHDVREPIQRIDHTGIYWQRGTAEIDRT